MYPFNGTILPCPHCPSYLEDVQSDNGKWNSQNSTEKKKNPVKIRAQDMNSNFPKEDVEMPNKDIKTLSRPLNIKRIQIKTIIYHYSSFYQNDYRYAYNANCWQRYRKTELLVHWWKAKLRWWLECKCCRQPKKQFGNFLEN